MMHLKSRCSFFLIPLLLGNLPGPPAQAQGTPGIQIVIVEGEGAINNVKERLNREVIVQVEDQNHKPVAGAAVSFFLPNDGPGGTFANGTNNLTTTTNAQGRATARGIQFNAQAGAMQIRVAASYAGRTASIVVNESNVLSGASTPGSRGSGGGGGGGMSTSTKLLIIGAIVGGGVAAGVLLGSRSSSTATPAAPAPPTITITPGLVQVGGPQ
jgi:hypothetical protein